MSEDYSALWRSSAFEAVPYTDDFPEALLVLPELFDGSIGQGEANKITVSIQMNDALSGTLKVSDNGVGIKNERRLLQWAAQKAMDNLHRNGHGTKKCLTKWNQEYETAKWSICYRRNGKNLQHIKGPFKGRDTFSEEIEDDEKTLMPSGTEISIKFNLSVLASLSTSKSLSDKIREIIQTRYSQEILAHTEFVLDIEDVKKKRTVVSSYGQKWRSFKRAVEDSVENGTVNVVYSERHTIAGGYYQMDIFHIDVAGNTSFALKKEFPLYGCKSMKSSRAHISINGRMVEAIPIYKLLGKEANHNDFNGWLAFVDFIPNTGEDFDRLPVPCTTKVSFYENDPVFKEFTKNFEKIFRPLMNSSIPVSVVSKPDVPVLKTLVSVAKPIVSISKSSEPVTKPIVSIPKPSEPVAKPLASVPKTSEPVAKPVVSVPKTSEPVAKPVVSVPKPSTSILQIIKAVSEEQPQEINTPEVNITHSRNTVTITISNVEGRITADRLNAYIHTNGSEAFYKLLQ